jgi:hypothetical protein
MKDDEKLFFTIIVVWLGQSPVPCHGQTILIPRYLPLQICGHESVVLTKRLQDGVFRKAAGPGE